jgi:hypothetical protein
VNNHIVKIKYTVNVRAAPACARRVPGLVDHEVDQLSHEGPRQQTHPDPLRVRLTGYVVPRHKIEIIDDLELAEPSCPRSRPCGSFLIRLQR